MQRADIHVGHTYTDDKGNYRKVVNNGFEFVLYPGQMDTDTVQYVLLAKKSGPYLVGSICNCTLKSFASWAKRWTLYPEPDNKEETD